MIKVIRFYAVWTIVILCGAVVGVIAAVRLVKVLWLIVRAIWLW